MPGFDSTMLMGMWIGSQDFCLFPGNSGKAIGKGSHVFLHADLKSTSSLANVHHLAVQTGDPVHNSFFVGQVHKDLGPSLIGSKAYLNSEGDQNSSD